MGRQRTGPAQPHGPDNPTGTGAEGPLQPLTGHGHSAGKRAAPEPPAGDGPGSGRGGAPLLPAVCGDRALPARGGAVQPSRDRARPSRRSPSLSAGGRRSPVFPGSRAVGGDPAFSSGRRSVSAEAAEADDGPRWGGRRCPGRGAGAGPRPQPAGRGPGAAGAVSPAAGPGRGGGFGLETCPGAARGSRLQGGRGGSWALIPARSPSLTAAEPGLHIILTSWADGPFLTLHNSVLQLQKRLLLSGAVSILTQPTDWLSWHREHVASLCLLLPPRAVTPRLHGHHGQACTAEALLENCELEKAEGGAGYQ